MARHTRDTLIAPEQELCIKFSWHAMTKNRAGGGVCNNTFHTEGWPLFLLSRRTDPMRNDTQYKLEKCSALDNKTVACIQLYNYVYLCMS